MTEVHPFQKWVDDNGVIDIVFCPVNPSESTAMSLLDSAHKAVLTYEAGRSIPYVGNVPQ